MCGSGSHKERGGTLHWCNCGVFSKETSYKDNEAGEAKSQKLGAESNVLLMSLPGLSSMTL